MGNSSRLLLILAISSLLTACGGGSSSSSGGGSCADSISLVVKNPQGAIIPSGGTYPAQNGLFFVTVTVMPNPGPGVDIEFRGTLFASPGSVFIDRTDAGGNSKSLPFRFGYVFMTGPVRPSGSIETIFVTSSCVSSEWVGTVQ